MLDNLLYARVVALALPLNVPLEAGNSSSKIECGTSLLGDVPKPAAPHAIESSDTLLLGCTVSPLRITSADWSP